MADLLDTLLPAIPETFFRRLEERMNDGAAVAHTQALRTPAHLPAHRMRLGTTRYFERGEALRLSAEDVGLSHRYVMVNTHAEIGKCQGSCRINHVMFASAFSCSRGGFPGLSKTEAGGVQLRVGPDQRVGLSSLAA